MSYTKRGIVLINEDSGERKEFSSINSAARFLKTNFANIQMTAFRGGSCRGWLVLEDAGSIRRHIKDLEEQLKIVEG